MTCICGHVEDEHGGDPKYPASTACNATVPNGSRRCDCIAYEPDEVDHDEDEED